jgi:pimeloyl-ACP methyl ester carboxylesterase
MAPHFFTEDFGIAEIAKIREVYETTDLRAKLGRWHRDPDNAFRGWNGAWLDPAFREWDITAELAAIRAPLLIIQGADDQYGTLRQVEVAQEVRRGAVETAILPATKHVPHRESPAATMAAIVDFTKRLQVKTGQ